MCSILCDGVPRARSPDIHACLAKVAEIRWKRCVPGSRLGIARLREAMMLQMMYLRMTDTKSAARQGEGVHPFFCDLHSDGLSYRWCRHTRRTPLHVGEPVYSCCKEERKLLICHFASPHKYGGNPSSLYSFIRGFACVCTKYVGRLPSPCFAGGLSFGYVRLEEYRSLSHTAFRWQVFLVRLMGC